MRKTTLALTFAALATLAVLAPANAQYCEGTVHGLSKHYNPDTGAGFLAVRSRPNASSHKRGELFNGDKVEIFDRRGNWYKVATQDSDMLEGWAHAKWMWNSCNY
jgi:uncharacterized protein YgiM (DUF1202 family)